MRIGQLIGKGKFRLVRLVARGGMGLTDRSDGTQAVAQFIFSALAFDEGC